MRERTRSMVAAAAAAAAAAATSAVKTEEQAETSYLDFISLPIIRLDEFDQDELRLLAQYSGDFPEARFQNIVVPKIDRRIFNESAGSRRQTYGKCFASRHWNTVPDNADDTGNEEEEDSEPARSRSRGRPRKKQTKQQRKVSVTEKTRSAEAVARVIERKGRLRYRDSASDEGREGALGPSSAGASTMATSWIRRERTPSAASHSNGDSEWINSAEKAVGTSVKRGRPRKLVSNELPMDGGLTPHGATDNSRKKQKQEIVSLEVEEDCVEDLSRRTRKRRYNANYSIASGFVDGRGSKRKGEGGAVLGRNGEIDRQDGGVRKYFGEEELMETLRKMKGDWTSGQMKRKIVDATGFPKGWTVLVGLRHTKDGRAYFDYREWRSPEGRVWTSYKEAAAYLVSTVGKDIRSEELAPSSADQVGGCEQKALTADGENGHEPLCSGRDQSFRNGSSFAALLNSHDGQLFFETNTEGDLQSLERSLQEDFQHLERGACEGSIENPPSSGDHVDNFLRISCKSDDVAISPQVFGGQVTTKMEPSTCGEDSRNPLLGPDGNLKSQQSDCEVQDLIVNIEHACETVPEECQSAPEVDGSKAGRESSDDLLKKESDDRRNSKHLNDNDEVRSSVQIAGLERGHVCHLCGMRFPSSLKLRRHLRRSKHLKFLTCEVCGKKFTSISLLRDHRLKTGHPRTFKVNLAPTYLPAEVSNSVEKSSQSVMSNIVRGLLSDIHRRDGGWHSDQPFPSNQTTNRPTDIEEGKSVPHMLESVMGKLGEVTPSKMPEVFVCETCHKVFHHQSKYWGHLSVHSSKKGVTGLATPRRLNSPRTLPVPDGVYECDVCHKVFRHQSKFWGHLSVHSSKRTKAQYYSTLHDPENEKLASRTVEEPEPSVRELVSGSNEVEVSHTACFKEPVTKSLFWKLLDDSIPPEGASHEPVPYVEEATIRPLASCTKEEAANCGGNIGFRATLDMSFGPTSDLPQVKSSSSVLSIHSDSLFSNGLLEGNVGEHEKIISDMSVGIETIWKELSENPRPTDPGNEACPVCRKDDDQPRHLICDWCEKEFHQGCVSPVLHEVPLDWICPFCRTKDTQTF